VPVSGITVKRTLSSSRRTQATLPKDDNEAVSSAEPCQLHEQLGYKQEFHTREGLDVPNRGLEPHFGNGRVERALQRGEIGGTRAFLGLAPIEPRHKERVYELPFTST
jgi:hypothetical protein